MKISRAWLQAYFDTALPELETIADALTFHAFEIESIENDILDVKITANRGHDCLSHRGIAKELSAILDIPLKSNPLTMGEQEFSGIDAVRVDIEDQKLCRRYIAGYIRGAKVGPSPAWLRERLESIGQKSINNVVDAANFVMFDIGQPLHAFDAGKRTQKDGAYSVRVRLAHEGEKLVTLDDKEQQLSPSMLMIADGHTDEPLGIAGVKGGKESGVSGATTDLILESANFDGPSLRKTSRALKFRTDATQRFEQVISPELAAHGMRAFADLVLQVAGGELVGFVDAYPEKDVRRSISIELSHINRVLGLQLSTEDVGTVFTRLGFTYEKAGDAYAITTPFERLDVSIPEDLIEEVGRIIGYDKVPAIELPVAGDVAANVNVVRYATIRDYLVSQGFSEVFTSVFAEKASERCQTRSVATSRICAAISRTVLPRHLSAMCAIRICSARTR